MGETPDSLGDPGEAVSKKKHAQEVLPSFCAKGASAPLVAESSLPGNPATVG
jgi:hypothetical protein